MLSPSTHTHSLGVDLGGEGLFCLPAIQLHMCLPPPKHLLPDVPSGSTHFSTCPLHRVYNYSRSSLFRVMAWAARARGPCCVKWYPKRTIDGHCSSTVAISISTASPGHWRWGMGGGVTAISYVWQFTTLAHGPLGS